MWLSQSVVACFLLSICFSYSALALNPANHISQYAHTAWRVQDGSVDPAAEITQTADGYLWLGTSNGLLRFDGIKFVRYAPPGLNLPTRGFTFLLGARDGSLWIGTSTGLRRLKEGRLESYAAPNERIGISTILEDDEGTIWVTRYRVPVGQGPLCRVEGDGLHCYGKADGILVHYGLGLTRDKAGNLWFGSSVLYRWRPGSVNTYLNYLETREDAGEGVIDVAAGASGQMWAAIDAVGPDLGIRHFSDGKWEPFVIPGLDGPKIVARALFVDRNQSLWIGTDKGLYRVHDGVAEHFGTSDGLSGDGVGLFYEDHEGNIWVCTDGGLDMFRDIPVVSYSSRDGLSGSTYSILALHDSSVWIGTDHGIDILEGARLSVLTGKELSGVTVTALFQDHRDVVWVGAGHRLLTYEHGRLEKVLAVDGAFSAISEDTEQNIWALTGNHLLFRIRNRIAQQVKSEKTDSRWNGLVPDPAGGIWIASANGNLTHYRDQDVHTTLVNSKDSSFSAYGVMADIDNSVLEFTSKGLFRRDESGWKVLDSRNGLPCDVIYSGLIDSDQSFWLYSQCGLVKVDRSELEKWRHDSASRLEVQIFDKFDGAHPGGAAYPAQPIASKATDGRLWFINIRSAQAIDPKQLFRNSILPPVHIEKILADHKDYALENGLRLPALSRDVEIDYAALSFAVPQKVRFRYELQGHDRTWQEAGTRREAFYTDLSPGSYHFSVAACNNDGVWNNTGASLDFSIAPAYYQTHWFRAACLVLFTVLIWILYRLRVRSVEQRYLERSRAEEAVRSARAELAHIHRVSTMGELTASLAHEIKQPIGAAVTNAEACVRLIDRHEPDLQETREAALEMIKDARRAADIIDRVRLLYQKGSPQLDMVDLNELAREMMIVLHNEAKRHSVAMRTDLTEGLPKVMADRVQLQQALMNLMLNGIEAIRDSTGELSIKSQLWEDGQVLISVSDTGVGLPTGNADQIFDAFFTTKSQGTGLGLKITRSIVESHGGRIWATPNSGPGATFQFTLPIREAAVA